MFNFKKLFAKKKSLSSLSTLLSSNSQSFKKWDGSFFSAYKINLYVNSAIRKRAEKVNDIEFIITDKEGNKKESLNAEQQHIINLLNKPNVFFHKDEFWGLFQKIKDCYGEVYLYLDSKSELFNAKKRRFENIFILNPEKVKVKFNQKGTQIESYQYEANNGKTINYSPDEIIRSYYPDPSNIFNAVSLLKAGTHVIDSDIQMSQYQANVLRNGGKVESVFRFKDDGLTQEQLKEAKEFYEQECDQSLRLGKPLFIKGDMDYIKVGLNLEELSYLESKKTTLNDICILTGVPKMLLGSVDDIKYSNANVSIRMFLNETIKPLLDNLVNCLNDKLFKDEEFNLSYIDPTPENKEEKRKDLETADKIHAMTINEKRNVLNLPEVKNGDDILIPFNLKVLGKEEIVEERKKVEEKEKVIKKKNILSNYSTRRKYWKVKNASLSEKEREMQKKLKSYFTQQEKRLLQSIKNRKNIIDENFNQNLEIKLAYTAFAQLLEKYLVESGEETMLFVGNDRDFLLDSEVRSWLDQRTSTFTRSITETTFKKLEKELSENIINNESREDLIKRIQNVYGDINSKRAWTIARTEVGIVTSRGTYQAYEQSGVETKIWVTTIDSRTRDGKTSEANHIALDGEEVPLNKYFSNGLKYPRDSQGSADEIINCRCQF